MLTKTWSCFLHTPPYSCKCPWSPYVLRYEPSSEYHCAHFQCLLFNIHMLLNCNHGFFFLLLNCIIVSMVTVQHVPVWLQTLCKKSQQDSKFFFLFHLSMSVWGRSQSRFLRFLWREKISRLCVWLEWEGGKEKEGKWGRSNSHSSTGWLETRGLLCWSL